jgi:hypothetical protein
MKENLEKRIGCLFLSNYITQTTASIKLIDAQNNVENIGIAT